MRILVVTNMFPTTDEPWFGSFVRDQVDDLRALGLEVDLLHFDGRLSWRAYLRAIRDIRARIRSNAYDVVHAHYGLTGAAAVLAFPSPPLLTTFHGTDYGGPAWQRLVSMAVARRSTCIVVSEEGRFRLRAPRAGVIPMGVDTARFVPLDRAAARRRLSWSEHARYALLAGGRTNPVKRADMFDAAVACAREQVPELIGTALEGYDRELVPVVLNAADVTVLTSDREGSPLTLRESLACATPVVAVPVGDAPTMLDDLPACAVVHRDPKRLADAIIGALDATRDPAWRERAELWSRESVARRVRDVYEFVSTREGR